MHDPLPISHELVGSIRLPLVHYWGEQWVPITTLAHELAIDTQRLVRAIQSEHNPKLVRVCSVLAPHASGAHQLAVTRGSLIAIHGRLRPKSGTKLAVFLEDLHLMAGLSDPEEVRELASISKPCRKPKKAGPQLDAVPLAELMAKQGWITLVHRAAAKLAQQHNQQPKRGRPTSISAVTIRAIQRQHANGTSIQSLADMYRLAPDTMRRIVKGTYQTKALKTGRP